MNIDWTMALSTVITGISVVFIILLLLILVMVLISKVVGAFSGAGKKDDTPAQKPVPKPAPVQAAPSQPTRMAVEDGVGDEVIAVISAAVAAMMGGAGYAIKSVSRARKAPEQSGRASWRMAGLQQNTQPF